MNTEEKKSTFCTFKFEQGNIYRCANNKTEKKFSECYMICTNSLKKDQKNNCSYFCAERWCRKIEQKK